MSCPENPQTLEKTKQEKCHGKAWVWIAIRNRRLEKIGLKGIEASMLAGTKHQIYQNKDMHTRQGLRLFKNLETIQHTVTRCKMQIRKAFTKRHDQVVGIWSV